MKSRMLRTVIVTSIVTSMAVAAMAMIITRPSLTPSLPMDQAATMTPAVYNGNQQYATEPQAVVAAPQQAAPQVRRPSAVRRTAPVYRQTSSTESYGEPVRRNRSTRNSVLIVAGSAGTGAAIGALAGGGKGAGIGALAGGAAGLVYDRLTANK